MVPGSWTHLPILDMQPCCSVFGNIDGTVEIAGDVVERWPKALKERQELHPELSDLITKLLRHAHATLWLESGARAKVVQDNLSLSNNSLIVNTYSHVIPTM